MNYSEESFFSFIAKPLNGQCGVGVKIIKVTGCTAEKEFNELFASGKWIIEELIRQSPEMSDSLFD